MCRLVCSCTHPICSLSASALCALLHSPIHFCAMVWELLPALYNLSTCTPNSCRTALRRPSINACRFAGTGFTTSVVPVIYVNTYSTTPPPHCMSRGLTAGTVHSPNSMQSLSTYESPYNYSTINLTYPHVPRSPERAAGPCSPYTPYVPMINLLTTTSNNLLTTTSNHI